VASCNPEARKAPLGDHATEVTISVWPSSTADVEVEVIKTEKDNIDSISHTRTVSSTDAEAKKAPLGDHATEYTPRK
jgi:hypothetical protein